MVLPKPFFGSDDLLALALALAHAHALVVVVVVGNAL